MRLSHAARAGSGTQEAWARPMDRTAPQQLIPITELLTASFVIRHTRYPNLGEWLFASGLDPYALLDPEPHTQRRWDEFTRLSTTFPDWSTMLREAGAEWVIRRIGIIIDA